MCKEITSWRKLNVRYAGTQSTVLIQCWNAFTSAAAIMRFKPSFINLLLISGEHSVEVHGDRQLLAILLQSAAIRPLQMEKTQQDDVIKRPLGQIKNVHKTDEWKCTRIIQIKLIRLICTAQASRSIWIQFKKHFKRERGLHLLTDSSLCDLIVSIDKRNKYYICMSLWVFH